MNVHDELTDNEVLRDAADSLARIPVADAPDVAAVMARGRARRRHRFSGAAGIAVAATAVVSALAFGLTSLLGPAAAHRPGTIRAAAYSFASQPNGTVTLTINPEELLDPAALQSDLARYGIPAMVTTGSMCTSDPAPAGFSQVVSSDPAGPFTATPVLHPTITIDPAAMPDGAELSLGSFQLTSGEYAGEQQADLVLIDASSYTCSSIPPDPNSLPDGYGESDGIGLLYGGPAGA